MVRKPLRLLTRLWFSSFAAFDKAKGPFIYCSIDSGITGRMAQTHKEKGETKLTNTKKQRGGKQTSERERAREREENRGTMDEVHAYK